VKFEPLRRNERRSIRRSGPTRLVDDHGLVRDECYPLQVTEHTARAPAASRCAAGGTRVSAGRSRGRSAAVAGLVARYRRQDQEVSASH